MADETDDININLNVNGPENIDAAITSVTGLKKAYKDAMNEVAAGTEGAAKRAADLKDRLEDLKDETQSLKGTGIEKLTSSMNLLKEGFVNADPGKLGIAMKGLGAAMKAIPIFLIIEGIRYLIENFEKLTNSGGLLGKVFSAIGEVIDAVIQAFKDFTDWLGITNNAIEDNAELQIEAAKKTQEAVTTRYDAEIKLAKAAGKETFDLEIKKQQAVIDSAKVQFEAIKAVAAANGEVTKEQEENVLALGKVIQDANLEIQVRTIEHNKSISEINGKAYEEKKAKADKESADNIAASRKELERLHEIRKGFDVLAEQERLAEIAKNDALAEQETQKIQANLESRAELIKYNNEKTFEGKLENLKLEMEAELLIAEENESEKLLIKQKYADAEIKIKEENAAKEKQINQQTVNSSLQIAKVSTDGLIALSDLYFAVKAANTSKGSAEELKAAKQQFKINKALSLTNATIMGIQSVIAAYQSGAAVPIAGVVLGPAMAVLAGIAAAANIAKIAGTQFNPGGGSAGSVTVATPSAPPTPSLGGGGSSSSPVAPSFALFGNKTGNGSNNNLSNNGSAQQPTVLKAYVVGQEITDQQTADKYSTKMGEL